MIVWIIASQAGPPPDDSSAAAQKMTDPAPGRTLAARFAQARVDKSQVVLEGFHAVKHALRFGAEIELAVTQDRVALVSLARDLAPDLASRLEQMVREVEPAVFATLAPIPPATGLLALAQRPSPDVATVWHSSREDGWQGPPVCWSREHTIHGIPSPSAAVPAFSSPFRSHESTGSPPRPAP